MKERENGKFNIHSIIIKFLVVFLLFGGILIAITVSIQNDLSRTTAEELIASQERECLAELEKNLGDGDWSVRNNCLYKGETPIGSGTLEDANTEPFIKTEKETSTFVYSFLDVSAADGIPDGGEEHSSFLRVAGSTLDSEGNPIVGTFLDVSIAEELKNNEVFTGRSFVEGRLFYCYYTVIRNAEGSRVGALVAGRSFDEIEQRTVKSALNSSLAVGVIIVYTFFALFLFVVKWNRSLKRMEKHLTDIGNGDFPKEDLKISGGDELGEMADVINEMKLSLMERERLKNELEFARTIQAEMLPDDDAAKKLPNGCTLAGFMAPAKEVGGDLYDFFITDAGHLGLVIADVSDKGTPAALFMATAKMCIKDNMMLGAEPKDVLFRVNNQLLENSKSGLFVTAWIGELDPMTGVLKYAAAGHPFPFIRRAGDSGYSPLESDINLVLAGKRNFEFLQEETELKRGDRLFLYTDGLDEARNKEGGFFGKQRIREYLDGHTGESVRETLAGMKNAVDRYSDGREQFDDMTMLMLEYRREEANE